MYAITKISLSESPTNIKTSGCFDIFEPVNFRNDLAMAPWYLVAAESDPNKLWGIWKQIFEYIADSHAPLKKKRVRGSSVPWITPELKHDMFERDRLQNVASKSRSDTDWTNYKQRKNKVNHTIKEAKTALLK